MTASPVEHLLAGRAGAPVEQGRARQQETGGAEAALRGVMLVESRLHGRKLVGRAEALDGRDRRSLDSRERQETRPARLAVDEDRAGAAATLLAAGLWAREVELLAEHVQE